MSDGVFSIVGPMAVRVGSPNGGEQWEEGSNHTITWASTGAINDVAIEHSTDNGAAWEAIVGSTPNDGSYDWLVPDTPSDDCLIRISAVIDQDPRPSDVSDEVFSIVAHPCYDFDDSGQVDVNDIQQVASRWRTSRENPDPDNNPETPNYDARYDIDQDDDIDIVDVMLVVAHWGETCD